MKLIKELCEMVNEELEDAEKYVKCALKHREDKPALAQTFYDLSTDELRHSNLLHGEVVELIEEHRKKNGEPPLAMLAVYEYLHEKQIEKANQVKLYQGQYRG